MCIVRVADIVAVGLGGLAKLEALNLRQFRAASKPERFVAAEDVQDAGQVPALAAVLGAVEEHGREGVRRHLGGLELDLTRENAVQSQEDLHRHARLQQRVLLHQPEHLTPPQFARSAVSVGLEQP
eukprot:3370129-Rhodomonas_salina.2